MSPQAQHQRTAGRAEFELSSASLLVPAASLPVPCRHAWPTFADKREVTDVVSVTRWLADRRIVRAAHCPRRLHAQLDRPTNYGPHSASCCACMKVVLHSADPSLCYGRLAAGPESADTHTRPVLLQGMHRGQFAGRREHTSAGSAEQSVQAGSRGERGLLAEQVGSGMLDKRRLTGATSPELALPVPGMSGSSSPLAPSCQSSLICACGALLQVPLAALLGAQQNASSKHSQHLVPMTHSAAPCYRGWPPTSATVSLTQLSHAPTFHVSPHGRHHLKVSDYTLAASHSTPLTA